MDACNNYLNNTVCSESSNAESDKQLNASEDLLFINNNAESDNQVSGKTSMSSCVYIITYKSCKLVTQWYNFTATWTSIASEHFPMKTEIDQ